MLVQFKYRAPDTVEEACLLARENDARFLQGGTDVLIEIRARQKAPAMVISLGEIAVLKQIRREGDVLFIGSGTPLSMVATHPYVHRLCPALSQAILNIGSPQIRNTGTLGGNVATASPAADGLIGLFAEEAMVEISDGNQVRLMPVEQIVTGPKKTSLQQGELITGFYITPQKWDFSCFFKKGKRNSLAISIVNGVVKLRITQGRINDCRIVVGAVAATPLRLREVEEQLKGKMFDDVLKQQVIEAVMASVSPISDIRASADYRRYIVGATCAKLLAEGWEAAQHGE